MESVTAHLSIGDFSRATHMTVKMLRHYHQIGLLEPADVDPHTGYRRYTAEQIPTAQVIRRLRGLDMPLEEIQAVLAAHVARHALAVAGPIREYYLVGPDDTADEAGWRTEIGWPVFTTGWPAAR